MSREHCEKAAVATIDIDWHWKACEYCAYWNPEMDNRRGPKGGCDKGITSERDSRIREDYDFPGDGAAYCSIFEEGEWKSEEKILAQAKVDGIIFDHPDQRFLFEGLSPILEKDLIEEERKKLEKKI